MEARHSRTIDVNCDMGEGYGIWKTADDQEIMPHISSANIACGFHAGDPTTMMVTTELAITHAVRVGAHVSYRDIVGFGRRFIDISPEQLKADIVYQLGALDGIAGTFLGAVAYVKPHGALYNTINDHEEQARATVEAVLSYDASLPVLGMPGSRFLSIAQEAEMEVYYEAFPDRNYSAPNVLLSRKHPQAVITDPQIIAERIINLVEHKTLTTIEGKTFDIPAHSVCLHSDAPGSAERIQRVRGILAQHDVTIQSFID